MRIPASAISSFLAATLLLGSPARVHAQRERGKEQPSLPIPPPQPVPAAVKVKRGGKVEIPLGIYGHYGQPLQFVIRTAPEHGKLSEPRPTGKGAAIVVYEPPENLAVTRASFAYATQSARGVSAAADVTITIVDDAPVLVIPDTIDFPPLLAGASAAQEIEVANTGGGMAEGEVEVDMPWQIEGPRAYQLAAGQRQRFTLVFAPDSAGMFRREVRYTSHRDRTTLLRGEARAAIAAEPATVELRHEPGNPARQGVFHISNHTSEDQVVTLVALERLQGPTSVTVPAGDRVPVSLSTAPADVAPLREEVRLAGASMELRVPVRAAAVAPIIRSTAAEIDFGQAAAGQPTWALIEVENAGGTEGFWRVEAPAPVIAEPAEARLAPGAKRKIGLTLLSPEPGQFRSLVTLRGEGQSMAIPFQALVTSTSAPPPRAIRASARASQIPRHVESGSRERSRDDAEDEPASSGTAASMPVPNVRLAKIGRDHVVLEWPAAISQAKEFRVEARHLSRDANRELKIEWVEHRAMRIRADGNKVRAEITNLQPGSGNTFRVIPVTAGAGAAEIEPLFSVTFRTAPKLRLRDIFTLPRVLGAALVVCLSLLGWQKYRARL